MRMPLGPKGLPSNGIAFLFTVIPASPNVLPASKWHGQKRSHNRNLLVPDYNLGPCHGDYVDFNQRVFGQSTNFNG